MSHWPSWLSTGILAIVFACSRICTAQTLTTTVNGAQLYENFGTAVAFVGDVNLDGVVDLAVSAPNHQTCSLFTCSNPGQVRVLSGADQQVLLAMTGVVSNSFGPSSDLFGASLAGGLDVNLDGYPDIVVGEPLDRTNCTSVFGARGSVHVYSGFDGSLLHSILGSQCGGFFSPSATMGSAVGMVHDVNGDGRAEFLVSSPGTWVVEVRSGLDGSVLSAPAAPSTAVRFGDALAVLGDINGDGIDEYLVGAPHFYPPSWLNSDHGAIFACSASTGAVVYSFSGSNAGDQLGAALARIDDVNGDGVADFAAGAPGWDVPGAIDAGGVFIYSGATGAWIRSVLGSVAGQGFGSKLSGGGDIDGDGAGDLLVGIPQTGEIVAVSGGTGNILYTLPAPTSSSGFGSALAGPFDMNQDGNPELVAGAPSGTPGQVFIYASRTLASIQVPGPGCLNGSPPQLSSTPPILGGTVTLSVTQAPPALAGALFVSNVPLQPYVIAPGCSIWVDPLAFDTLASFTTDPAGQWALALSLPNLPALAGVRFALQAAVAPTGSPLGLDLTNGLYLTLGY